MPAGAPDATWDGGDYACHSVHHRRWDEWFLDRRRPRPDDVVVDAGSGSGEFTARLAELVADGRVIGVEPDPSMLAVARERIGASNVELREGRIQDLDEVCAPGSADLVVSRAVLHWIDPSDYLRCFVAMRRVLVPGGWVHTESGGSGNVRRVEEVLDGVAVEHGLGPPAAMFPHAGFALEVLERAGFEVPPGGARTVAQRRAFDREGLLGFLRSQASLAYVAGAPDEVRDAFLRDVEARVDDLRRHDGSYDQTFVRLDLLGRRPS